MTDEAKRLVDALREDAEWAQANEWEAPITLGDNLTEAADMIENLSANLDSDERQKSREIFEISSKAIAKLEADRDAWKLRCEAAERDMTELMKYTVEGCEYCKKGYKGRTWSCSLENCEPVWRGPCAENGGMKDD